MSDVNNPIITPDARKISGRCLLNGEDVSAALVSFDVTDNGFRGASTFELTLGISKLPKQLSLQAWWASQIKIKVELSVSITTKTGTNTKRLIIGNIDRYRLSPARFEITADGRDLAGLLIDSKSAGESFKNYTSSQIATLLANRHGLTPKVTATTGRFGDFYQIDSTHLTGEMTEWDLLTTLAGIENYQTYINGENLVFEPVPDPAKADNYVIRWQPPGVLPYPQCNMSDDLEFERALTISKGVTVEVMSWNVKRKNKQFTASYPKYAKSTTPGNAVPQTQIYRVIRNGLTPADAYTLAQKIYSTIVAHEMKFSGSTAGDNLLTPQTLVRIEGTKSLFDQLYWCDSVRRSFNLNDGYIMNMSGKNHSPALDVSEGY